MTQTTTTDVCDLERLDPLTDYLQDPFLLQLFSAIANTPPLKAISVDITHVCNLRCDGCYFFSDGLDQHQSPQDESVFDAFIAQEKARGTNFITVLGGEPSLMLERLKKLHQNFWVGAATNGLIKIPSEGFENLSIGIGLWGDRATDKTLRGGGKLDIFSKALKNYKDDARAFWYYTTTPDNIHEIEPVVEQCVANGNYVLFNYYSGEQTKRDGSQSVFEEVRREIDRAIARYPDRILMTAYMNQVFTSGLLYGDTWGYEVCPFLSENRPENAARFRNGKPYSPHFRAYNPDLTSTRRCCTSENIDCSTCHHTWSKLGWIAINLERHLESKQEFTNWVTSTYLFYLMNRIIDFETGVRVLPEIHRRIHNPSLAVLA